MIGLGNEFTTWKAVQIPPDPTQKNDGHRPSAPTVTQRAGEGLCRRVVDVEVNYNQVGVVLPCQARALDRRAGGIRAHSSAS